MYQALADPTRREILRLLRDGDLAAGEIAGHFEISWPAVSRHLGVLANAGLVHATRHGSNLVYTLTTSVLQDIATEVADLAHVGSAAPTKARRHRTREART
jgi:ArsR family transcriptional regulator, arsenate/arsenite/antimonite-responsive transcriptional repressor